MKEELLHFVWKTKRFDLSNLKTTDGQPLQILRFGHHNFNSGPDFLDARLKIGHDYWAGNIELHILASDWIKHQHQTDPAYQNVILHVVLEEDVPIKIHDRKLPTLTLKNRIDKSIIARYHTLKENMPWIPCHKLISEVDPDKLSMWLNRCLVERLEQKSNGFQQLLERFQHDWESALYASIARSFGIPVNAWPFERLAELVPLKIIKRHRDHPLQIEALLLGTAGLIPTKPKTAYAKKLQREYDFLANKYKIHQMDATVWKFSKMRPANFPTIRIVQLGKLLANTDALFSKILAAQNLKEIESLFNISCGGIWETHYHFGKTSPAKIKRLGKQKINAIIINSILPAIFTFGNLMLEPKLKEKAFNFLLNLPAEQNHLLSQWTAIGLINKTAYQSQALIHLKKQYCDQKRCLSCSIGEEILKQPRPRSISTNEGII